MTMPLTRDCQTSVPSLHKLPIHAPKNEGKGLKIKRTINRQLLKLSSVRPKQIDDTITSKKSLQEHLIYAFLDQLFFAVRRLSLCPQILSKKKKIPQRKTDLAKNIHPLFSFITSLFRSRPAVNHIMSPRCFAKSFSVSSTSPLPTLLPTVMLALALAWDGVMAVLLAPTTPNAGPESEPD